MNSIYVDVNNLKKTYKDYEGKDIVVFENLNFQAKAGEITIIMGPSGCGKSTLLNILSTIDNIYDEGDVIVNNTNIASLNESQKAKFRNENIGFVFQSHELIAEFNVLENCAIPLKLNGKNTKEAYLEAKKLLEKFGIPASSYIKYPRELSGGQQQRVGIIRAMINKPKIIFADEPTGNLDHISKEKVNNELKKLVLDDNSEKTALIIVTHDELYLNNNYSQSVYRFEEQNRTNETIKYSLNKIR
jgi:ABC-type lipoprotein export system ATPase subunit